MIHKLDVVPPFRIPQRPLTTTNRLQLIPGPTNNSPRVTRALACNTLPACFSPELNEIADKCKEMSQYVLQTSSPYVMIHQLSGNGANETMIANLTEPEDTVIVVVGGGWGERLADIAERHVSKVVVIKIEELGKVLTLTEIEKEIKEHKPSAFFIVHGDTHTGLLHPLEGIADICHKYNCLFGVDGIITAAATPVFFDRWNLDAITVAGQKALGATCGISILAFSERAKQYMFEKKTRPAYLLDAIGIGKCFNCFSDKDRDNNYSFYSFNSHLYCALHEALAEICEEGLENSWKRHKMCAEMLWEGLEKLGFTLPVKKECRVMHITIAKVPEDVKLPALLERLREKHLVGVGSGFGITRGCLRIGLMQYNAKTHIVEYFLEVLEESLDYVRKNKQDSPSELPEKASAK